MKKKRWGKKEKQWLNGVTANLEVLEVFEKQFKDIINSSIIYLALYVSVEQKFY